MLTEGQTTERGSPVKENEASLPLTVQGRGIVLINPSCSTQILESGYDAWTVQEYLGYKDLRINMIYTDVLNRNGKGLKSPLNDV